MTSDPLLPALFVHNVDYLSFKEGWFVNTPKDHTMLISICDRDKQHHIPKGSQYEDWYGYQGFYFDDINIDQDGVDGCRAMTLAQGETLCDTLQYCAENRIHVVVHCTAGLCRSGAVAEFLVRHYGYHAANPVRLPNIYVLNMLEEIAGFNKTADLYKQIFDNAKEFEGLFH